MARERLYLFDTTLRDGAQTNGVDFTLADKLAIARMLDELGIDYVEGGYPGANPTDTQLFRRDAQLEHDLHRLRHDAAARPLGLERSRPRRAARRQGRRHLLRRQVLGLSRARRAGDHGRGKPRLDPRQRARRQGARAAKCCSTASISSTATRPIRPMRWPAPRPPTRRARAGSCSATPTAARCRTRSRRSSARWCKAIPGDHVGIHAHNDTEQAVANSFAAVRAGARQIQGTLNGLGERCGNANLVSIIPTLKLKPEFAEQFDIGVSDDKLQGPRARLARARRAAQPRARPPRALCRRERLRHQGRHPCLRHHEGAGDLRARRAGERRQPAQAAGVRPGRPLQRARRARAHRPRVDKDDPRVTRLLDEVKEREAIGYAYEAADASFELLARRMLGKVPHYFDVEKFDVNVEQRVNAKGAARHREPGGGEGEGRRREHDLGRRRQRPGQRARPRAAQGSRQVSELHHRARSSPTTACVSSTAAPRRSRAC